MYQLKDNCASIDIELTSEQIKALDEVSELPPEYPGWMMLFQASDRLNPKVNRLEEMKEQLAMVK